jgi:hypothetical protein
MKLDSVTTGAMVKVFGSTGLAMGLLMTVNAFGFGVYIAAITMLKALSRLTGISLAFGAYVATDLVRGVFFGRIGFVGLQPLEALHH